MDMRPVCILGSPLDVGFYGRKKKRKKKKECPKIGSIKLERVFSRACFNMNFLASPQDEDTK